MGGKQEAAQVLAAKFAVIFPHLDERQRRLLMGAEARALGHGGIRLVARAAGAREATVSLGVDEVEAGAEPLGRARRPGPAAPRRPPPHQRPGTPWPRGLRPPGPPAGSRRVPAPGPRRPSAAAAAAHPDAGRSPRTSPPGPALLPVYRPYHSSMPHSRRLRFILLQLLSGWRALLQQPQMMASWCRMFLT